MLSLTIEAESPDELKAKLNEAAKGLSATTNAPASRGSLSNTVGTGDEAPAKSGTSPATKGKPAPKPAPAAKKPAAKSEFNPFDEEEGATETEGEAEEGGDGEEGEAAEEAAEPITFDQIKEALQKVFDEKGEDACKKIMKAMGTGKVSAVKEADYPKFIQLCEKALK